MSEPMICLQLHSLLCVVVLWVTSAGTSSGYNSELMNDMIESQDSVSNHRGSNRSGLTYSRNHVHRMSCSTRFRVSLPQIPFISFESRIHPRIYVRNPSMDAGSR